MHEKLSLQTEDLLRLINHMDVAVWIINMQNNKAFFSEGFRKIFGRSPAEFYQDVGLWGKTVHPEDVAVVQKRKLEKQNGLVTIDEYRIITPAGEVRWVQDRGIPYQDIDGQNIYIGIILDITERKMADEKIKYMAYHDDLTGLPNRKFFHEHLNSTITKAKWNDTLTLLFIDLDQFKFVNDSLGHNMGDQLLNEVGKRISSCVRTQDMVARHAGDEFLILIENVSKAETDIIAERILSTLEAPFTIQENEIFISASIGISIYPLDGSDSETLIKNADAAMYDAKYYGKNNSKYYSVDIENANNRKMSIINGLHKALENNEFKLYYQPKIITSSQSVFGVEALIRWNHPILGPISPTEFIPLAEETGMIIPIGDWVLQEACKDYKDWELKGIAPQSLCINISPRQLRDPLLLNKIKTILEEYHFIAQHLEIEITESVAIDNFEDTISKLNQIRKTGVKVALDDFGTGYSSLNYLRQFPIDALKIDRTFINEVMFNSQTAAIVKSIISIAHSLNLPVIAEGVETEEQFNFLYDLHCDFIQGYLISPPVPLTKIEEILKKNTSPKV
ncbi:putative bifunctional diguanylate cyclase/phosphodiesterase [Neobacillus niacini]|uniref:putative bifunctional diguanylate cyclase/phosphodiesterase n=1 Tax=Neobacillus niacini TaxID=86668 RepID=UPI003983AB18